MLDDQEYTQNPSMIIDYTKEPIPFIIGDMPGSPEDVDQDGIFHGGFAKRPIHPKEALGAIATNGALAAIGHVVAEGTAGMDYIIEPRFDAEIAKKPREKWPDGAADERDMVDIFVQAGFMGDNIISLRDGFYRQEHDRFSLGWGGVIVFRSLNPDEQPNRRTGITMPPRPIGLGRFEAAGAEFTKPDRKATRYPIPVALDNGRIIWVEHARHFRRIAFKSTNGQYVWYKEYGDWRAMDAKTGKYSNGNRHTPPTRLGEPGQYRPGSISRNGQHALEVMHWATSFPGMAPYGLSGWHSELTATRAAYEHVKLVFDYLKSGLHSIILAAASKPFEHAAAESALKTVDELGRGRKGLGKLILLSLVPDADNQTGRAQAASAFAHMEGSAERGRIILQEISTKLPSELLGDIMSEALTLRLSHAERIPGILIGRSDEYTFATAAAAWKVVNRLRFMPHHKTREAFFDRLLIEMGVRHWQIRVSSPEWEEQEPISVLAEAIGKLGGVSVNKALTLLNKALGTSVAPIDEWWGNLPMMLVQIVLTSPDPQMALKQLLGDDAPDIGENSVIKPIEKTLKALEDEIKVRHPDV